MKKIVIILAVVLTLGNSVYAQKNQPNVLIFLVDDLRPELGCYNNPIIKTPNIDKLASEGVLFDKAYCQQAICAPSRISILTGLRPETVGIYDLFTPLRSVHKDMVTIPQLFKENGYTTVSLGKVYHHGNDDKDNWSKLFPREGNTYANPENSALMERLKKEDKNPRGPAFESADVPDETYRDARVANNAIETLQKLKDEKFMMVVGFSRPHLPFNVPKKYWDLYDKNKFELPFKDKPEGMYPSALTNWGELRAYYGIPQEGNLSDDLSKELINGYYACVSYIDTQLGKVMQTLEDLDLRKNTIVILMSDHGWKLGEYSAWCKHTNFELDVKVPLIISRETDYKDRISNARTEALVENIDIFPTIAEACGLTPPKLDGKSLIPLIDNPKINWQDGAFSVYPRGKNMGFTCTDGNWRYTEWRNSATQQIVGIELYNHSGNNPIATKNFAGNANYEKIELRMKKLLEDHISLNPATFVIKKDKKPVSVEE